MPSSSGRNEVLRTASADREDPPGPRRLRRDLRLTPRARRPQARRRPRRPQTGRTVHAEGRLAGVSPRRGKGFTRRDLDADLALDLVQRDFTASKPNRLQVTDLTVILTREGPLWLSAIRGAFSRRVATWETSAHADADLVLTSLSSFSVAADRVTAAGRATHEAPVPLREVFEVSTHWHRSLVGSLSCRKTWPAACPGRMGHHAHRHPRG